MRRKVLVADDEPLTAEMLGLMLAFRGFEVMCAYDGAEALEQARRWKPDIMLLDVVMPELEGIAVTRALRDDDELRERPVILISSCDECEVEWKDAGADIFLQKPIHIVALPDLVECLLLRDDQPPPHRNALAA